MTDGPATFTLIFNGVRYDVALPRLSFGQIRAITAAPETYELIREGQGDQPDRPLREADVLDLSAGPVAIYGRPPTAFGYGRRP